MVKNITTDNDKIKEIAENIKNISISNIDKSENIRYDKKLFLYNEDCVSGMKKYIKDSSVNVIIADPPFGLNETNFHKHYKRKNNIINGYEEAPENYYNWSLEWIKECKRILTSDGTLYIIICWNRLYEILKCIEQHELIVLNHIIWKYNFGVYTTNKFVNSHYHILRIGKSKKIKFNTYCRFTQFDKINNKSELYTDLEDVFVINKEFTTEKKNINKLPSELINKLILYSSDINDKICDIFMGNFTSAYSSIKLQRNVVGFEINKESYDFHYTKLKIMIENSMDFINIKTKLNKPKNSGKRITSELKVSIKNDYFEMIEKKYKKNDIILNLMKKYERGKFSIINILNEIIKN